MRGPLAEVRSRLTGWRRGERLPTWQDRASLRIKRPLWRRPAAWLIGLALAVVLVFALAAAWYVYSLTPLKPGAPARRVVISKGESPAGIARQLQQQGIIRDQRAFRVYLRLSGTQNSLKAGAYALSPAMSSVRVAEFLYQGKVNPLKVTIPPGLTLDGLAARLKEYGFDRADIQAALTGAYQGQLFAAKPPGSSLEGYVFPDTYEILPGDKVSVLLAKTFNQFDRQLAAGRFEERLAQRGLNLYQGITLASIVQQEVGDPAQQKMVAMVFENRLRSDMPLGADVTFIYAAKQLGVTPNPSLDSPYNTRIHKGLPPGPISNFNLSALEAVTAPAPGDYLYFVVGDNGVIHYARTLAEHEQNVKNFCQKGCQ